MLVIPEAFCGTDIDSAVQIWQSHPLDISNWWRPHHQLLGRSSSVGIATRYGVVGPGVESRWSEIFQTFPYRHWGPHSLLLNGYWVSFLRVKRTESGIYHPSPSTVKIKDRVWLYLYSPSGFRLNFTFTILNTVTKSQTMKPNTRNTMRHSRSKYLPQYLQYTNYFTKI